MLNFAVVSDIHFYHRRTPTSHITTAFWEWIVTHHDKLAKCELLILAGDIFDRFIPSHYPDIKQVNHFFIQLGMWLKRQRIGLIVLEGTHSHDRGQFQPIYTTLTSLNVEVYYFDSVCVQTIHGHDFLFVPDNWHPSPLQTAADAAQAVMEHGVAQVDYAIMHGYMEYQLPKLVEHAFPQASFEALVKHSIHIGHVHTRSKLRKVHAQGSFDRLAHGEEELKGGDILINGKVSQLVNTHAYDYISVDLTEVSLADSFSQIATLAPSMQAGYLRIMAPRLHPIFNHFPKLIQEYPWINFERLYDKEKQSDGISKALLPVSEFDVLEQLKLWSPKLPPAAFNLIADLLNSSQTKIEDQSV